MLVSGDVPRQMLLSRKPLSTQSAFIWFLACVSTAVRCHMTTFCKCFSAVLTSIGSLACVNSNVFSQNTAFREALSAVIAFEGFLTCVGAIVSL